MTEIETGIRVLVVDDERDIRDGSERILTRMGHQVLKAGQGREALGLLEEYPADIVLLDLKMPGMDGLEALDKIRRSHPLSLVIIVTGFATIETAIEAMKKGAYDFMTKPFRPDQLRIVVNRAIEHIRLREERDRLSAERERGLWAITTEKSRLKTVVNSIVAGLLITERDKRIVMCNPAFYQIMNVSPEGVVGSFIGERPGLENVNQVVDEFLLGGSGEDGVVTREFVISGDRTTYVRASVNGVVSETGEILGLVTVIRDVTYFKELEKEKSAFVAMLTHELRAPLSAVDTQFHVVLKGLAGELSEKQRTMLGRMKQRIKGVMEMVSDLLDLSKIETRQFVLEKNAIDLNPIIEDTVDLMRSQAADRQKVLDIDLADSLPEVFGDSGSLKEVAANLISNAIKYTHDGGRIEVRTGIEGDQVLLTVADSGIGIAGEHQDKIFGRFYRVKNEDTRHVVGTGLGLPIVKAIVEDHEGSISLESEPGRGSVFKVRLPVMT